MPLLSPCKSPHADEQVVSALRTWFGGSGVLGDIQNSPTKNLQRAAFFLPWTRHLNTPCQTPYLQVLPQTPSWTIKVHSTHLGLGTVHTPTYYFNFPSNCPWYCIVSIPYILRRNSSVASLGDFSACRLMLTTICHSRSRSHDIVQAYLTYTPFGRVQLTNTQ